MRGLHGCDNRICPTPNMSNSSRPSKRRRRGALVEDVTLRAGDNVHAVIQKAAAEAASPYFARVLANGTATAIDIDGVTGAQLSLVATFCRESIDAPFHFSCGTLPSWSGQFDLKVRQSKKKMLLGIPHRSSKLSTLHPPPRRHHLCAPTARRSPGAQPGRCSTADGAACSSRKSIHCTRNGRQ